MARKGVSIRDVAERSGVSIATVSNVLNDRCPVSEELRERVQRAVRELDYVASPIARSMRSSKTFNIGVMVVDLNCIFFAPLLKGIQNVMSKAGYNVIVYDANYNAEKQKAYIRTMKNSLVDGLIYGGLASKQSIDYSVDSSDNPGFPVVYLEDNMTQSGVDSVFIDNTAAACTATGHLIELGCRRIVHIRAPHTVDADRLRREGYRKALADAGIAPNPALEPEGDYSAISGYNAIQNLLRADIPFDGVFAANDQMAVGALRALHNAGIAVPESVKVVGFDNTFIASIVDPGLTTIKVPIYEMGVNAARQLLDRIRNPKKKPVAIRLDYELIIRRSTMAYARTDWGMVYW